MGLQILQLEMERLSLAKAVSDRASKQRLQALDSQLKKLKGEQVSLPCMALTVSLVRLAWVFTQAVLSCRPVCLYL